MSEQPKDSLESKESNWEQYKEIYAGLKPTARCPITKKSKGKENKLIKNCLCEGCESWRTRPAEESKIDHTLPESISWSARAAIMGIFLFAMGTSIFSSREPDAENKPNKALPTLSRKENTKNKLKKTAALPQTQPKTLQTIPENKNPHTNIDVRYRSNGKNIIEAFIIEKRGQNRRFQITKGQTKDIFALPRGIQQRQIPGPKTIDHSYDLFQRHQNDQGTNYKIFLRIHIIRHGNRLTRVYAEGSEGIYYMPISPGMRGQNHFGIAADITDGILSGRLENRRNRK